MSFILLHMLRLWRPPTAVRPRIIALTSLSNPRLIESMICAPNYFQKLSGERKKAVSLRRSQPAAKGNGPIVLPRWKVVLKVCLVSERDESLQRRHLSRPLLE